MKVVLDGRMILPRMTGAGRYVLEVARRLPGMRPDLDLSVLLRPALESTEAARTLQESGVALEYVRASVASVRQWLEIPRTVLRLRPDLFHYPFIDLPFVSCRCIITVYDLNPLLERDYFDHYRSLKRWAAWRLLSSSVRRSQCVLAISHQTGTLLTQHLPHVRGKVRVVPLGADSSSWGESGESAVPADGRGGLSMEGRPYFLYVGVDRPHKNLLNLVRGFGAFRHRNQWAPGRGPLLLLAGVGDGSPQLRTLLNVTAGAADVHLSAPLDEVALGRVYRNATALAYVSTAEGFGLPILEGFCAGIPVIAGDRSSLPEVGGDAAEYCSPHDVESIARALDRVWHDEGLRRSLVERGAERARHFTWDLTARETLAAYEAAVGRQAVNGPRAG